MEPRVSYGELLKRSWNIVRKQRALWWLGLLVFLGSIFNNIVLNIDSDSGKDVADNARIAAFVERYAGTILLVAIVALLLALVFFFLKHVAQAALIKAALQSVEKKSDGTRLSFKVLFANSRTYFWRLLGLSVLLSLLSLMLILILIFPAMFLFYLKANILGTFVILGAMAIIIPMMVGIFFIKTYASIFVVSANSSLKEAVVYAYEALSCKLKESIIMGLIMVAVGFFVSMLTLLILLGIALAFVAVGGVLYTLGFEVVTAAVAILAAIVVSSVVLFIGSLYAAFRQIAWTLFFLEICSVVKKAEKRDYRLEAVPNPELI